MMQIEGLVSVDIDTGTRKYGVGNIIWHPVIVIVVGEPKLTKRDKNPFCICHPRWILPAALSPALESLEARNHFI